jgi:hypothetical protein
MASGSNVLSLHYFKHVSVILQRWTSGNGGAGVDVNGLCIARDLRVTGREGRGKGRGKKE